MRRRLGWLLAIASCVAAAVVASCVGDTSGGGPDAAPDSAIPTGAEGGPCFTNGTCNMGLACVLENGTGVCRALDASTDATDDVTADAPADALDDAAEDTGPPCSNVLAGIINGGHIDAGETQTLFGYAFEYVGPYDAGVILNIACSPDAAPFAPALHCPPGTTVLPRPADYGTPPDAGRTIHFSGSVNGNKCDFNLQVTAP